MEAHHLAKHKGMNFNSPITLSEERLVRKFFFKLAIELESNIELYRDVIFL
jgi:hypothetical protein